MRRIWDRISNKVWIEVWCQWTNPNLGISINRWCLKECNNQCGIHSKDISIKVTTKHLLLPINLFLNIKPTFNPIRILEASGPIPIKGWTWWARITTTSIRICHSNSLSTLSKLSNQLILPKVKPQKSHHQSSKENLQPNKMRIRTLYHPIPGVKNRQRIRTTQALIKTRQKSQCLHA